MRPALTLVWVLLLTAFSHSASAALRTDAKSYHWTGSKFSVPLMVKDNSGVARRDWPVTMGVPLPKGVVKDVSSLRLTDSQGREIPCQFRAISRYWALDDSVRWVLLDFQVTLAPNATRTVVLRNDRPATPVDHPIQITENDDSIVVDTGPLQAVISRRDGSILRRVSLSGHPVLTGRHGDGPRLRSGAVPQMERYRGVHWNTHGWTKTQTMEPIQIRKSDYVGGPPESVVVETSGPMHTVIRIRGTHLPTKTGPGIVATGMYNYTVRLHFYRGRPFIHVQYDVENSDPHQPQWEYLFRSAGLDYNLTLGPQVTATGGGLDARAGTPAVASVPLHTGQTAWLYQGPPANEKRKYGRPVVREGDYTFGLGHEGVIPSPDAAGHRARFLDVSDGARGLSISMRYFWEEAPRAISASPHQLQIFTLADAPGRRAAPAGHRPEYDLDFGERFISDILLYFHNGDAARAQVRGVAEAFEYRLAAYAPPAWYADTDTWYFELSRLPGEADRDANDDGHWFPHHVGAKAHGYNRSYNSGGNHESLNSGWLGYIRSGKLADWERNLVLSRWTISHNPGWAYRGNVLRFGKGDQRLSALDQQLDHWNRLTAFGPKDFYLWRSGKDHIVQTWRGPKKIPYGGTTYLNFYKWLPDDEHYALFRLFEYYYLTGDARALDSINGFVNWDINFQHFNMFRGKTPPLSDTSYFQKHPDAMRRGGYSRVFSWMLYTNLAGFQATGSPVFALYARWQVRRALSLLRQRHGQFTSWTDDHETDAKGRPIYLSRAQTWMEAQEVLALHEAYKTYHDERILDGLWAQADYFSHHVLFFPRLAMLNNRTSMPNKRLGTGKGHGASINPRQHDRYIQAFPLLYYYTGWPEVARRYRAISDYAGHHWIRDWFLQTGLWLRQQHPKRSDNPPDRITDLRVIRSDHSSVTLQWTSPHDDGPSGHAMRYFVKYSTKPIVDFAPMDNPSRFAAEKRITQQAEDIVLARMGNRKRPSNRDLTFRPGDTAVEPDPGMLADPRWHDVSAFWMAEHVAGEPKPSPAGTIETFTVRQLHPHNWFGLEHDPTIADLPRGKYYFAICSWDSDHNLSRVSNNATLELR